jgi:hypothetical protein
MGLPPRPVLGAAPPQGSGVPRRFQKRPLLPPSTEGMCVPALTQLMDCYSALGLDGMQEPGACFAERLDLINCQKREKYMQTANKSSAKQFREGLKLFRWEPKKTRFMQ